MGGPQGEKNDHRRVSFDHRKRLDVGDSVHGRKQSGIWLDTPPGRFLTTVLEMGLTFLFALGVLFVVVGIAIMAIEFFRKDS